MKTQMILSSIISAIVVLSACAGNVSDNNSAAGNTGNSQPTAAQTGQNENSPGNSKILVAYFTPAENGELDAITSASKVTYNGTDMGNAAAAANMIAEYTGADIFSIRTVKDYPIEYNDLADNAKAEQDAGELPELETHTDISGYETIFVVYPVWWYTMPQPIYSFFDEYDFSGKTIIPVTTHAGSRLADSLDRISELEPNASVNDSYTVAAADVSGDKKNIEKWLKGLGY